TNWSSTIDTTGLSQAAHTVTAVVADAAVNSTTSASKTVTRDVTAPSIAVTTPSNNSYINSSTDSTTFAVSGTCSEAARAVTVKVDESRCGGGGTCDGTNWSATIDTTGLTQAAHTIAAVVADAAGNS